MLTRSRGLTRVAHNLLSRHARTPTAALKRHSSSNSSPDPDSPSVSGAALTYPDAPSSQHADLSSFLAYAQRTGLNELSTIYVGTHYEYAAAKSLAKYGFFLKRVGGASDRGTDLVGTWTLPTTPSPLRVLVQCKAGAQRVGPHHVRELEGAFVGAPPGWRGHGVLGLLVSERSATKGVREALGRSRWPMGYVLCSKEGVVGQMLWNRRAEEEGLDGLGVVARHGEGEMDVGLMWKGKLLPFTDGSPSGGMDDGA